MTYDKNIELQEKQKAQERKYSIFLIFALCLLFLGQASAWTSLEIIIGGTI